MIVDPYRALRKHLGARVNESAFVSEVKTRPSSSLADRFMFVISGR
jgi:hypothetical protein